MMSKVQYPDDIIRARRQSVEVADNLEIWFDEGEFIVELFGDEYSAHTELADALDEAASLILPSGPVDSVEFRQTAGVWTANLNTLRADLYARRKHK